VLLLALSGFVAMVIMMLPHLARKEQNIEEQKSPGNIVVEMHWPESLDVDVGLWVQAPDDQDALAALRGQPASRAHDGGSNPASSRSARGISCR